MASDGQWYPQQWEYTWCEHSGQNTKRVHAEVSAMLSDYGKNGWEMINHTVTWFPATGGLLYTYTYYFKRPIRPGS